MAWTEITRRQYVREGLRYASDLTDCEWALLEPLMPPPSPIGRPRETDLARRDGRDPVYGLDGLPVAAIAEGLSALFDGARLFLRMDARWHIRFDQPHACHGGARARRTRGEPERGRDRQPVGQNHGKRRSTRL